MLADGEAVGHAGDEIGHGALAFRAGGEAGGHLRGVGAVGGKQLPHDLAGDLHGCVRTTFPSPFFTSNFIKPF